MSSNVLPLLSFVAVAVLVIVVDGHKSVNTVDEGDVGQACHSTPLVSLILFVEPYMSLPNLSASGNLSLHSTILLQSNCI